MMPGALAPYELSLRGAGGLRMVADDGSSIVLEIERYLDECDAVDDAVLERCVGPVLDIGCGPGRIVAALTRRGVPALGVDIAGAAVRLARQRGAAALRRDIFLPLPAEGGWQTAVVLDGNVGIGGDVDRLLGRLANLIAADGRIVIETAADHHADEAKQVRFAIAGDPGAGPFFPWAVAGTATVTVKAAAAGMPVLAQWSCGGRSFVELGAPAVAARLPVARAATT